MSDEDLRALERRWNETGAADDEAAYLLARARAGQLEPGALELAACLGHAPASLALRCPEPSLERLQEWLGAHDPSPATRARVAVAVAEAAVSAAGGNVRSLLAVRALEDWTLCPCAQHLSELRGKAQALSSLSPPSARCALRAVELALGEGSARFADVLAAASEGLAPDALWAAIGAEVAPWLLGRGDPLRGRVAGRAQG